MVVGWRNLVPDITTTAAGLL